MSARALRRGVALCASAGALLACSSLMGLGDLKKVDCIDQCGGTSAVGGTQSALGGAGADSGGSSAGKSMGSAGAGGIANGGASTTIEAGANGDAGSAGAGTTPKICPGGAAPPLTWTEHWFEHDQVLNRVYYDDCAAIYFDTDMDPTAIDWIAPFVSKAWEYSLKTYGAMGSDRVFGVFHMGRYGGGHAAYYFDASHDFRNTLDAGQNSWPTGSLDLPGHLLGFIVESTASHTKHGSPAAALWGNEAFSDLYKYDLYLGLGMTADAQAAYTKFTALSQDTPVTGSFWFRDWFYPIWRDYGHAQVMTRFFGLLQTYYPADATGAMADMNWGEYVHFMSGAAGKNLQPLAMTAFGWPTSWEQQLEKAQVDYPNVTY